MFDKDTIKALIGKALELAEKYAETTSSSKDDLIVDALTFLYQTLSPVFGSEGEPHGGDDLPVGMRSEITKAVEEASS